MPDWDTRHKDGVYERALHYREFETHLAELIPRMNEADWSPPTKGEFASDSFTLGLSLHVRDEVTVSTVANVLYKHEGTNVDSRHTVLEVVDQDKELSTYWLMAHDGETLAVGHDRWGA